MKNWVQFILVIFLFSCSKSKLLVSSKYSILKSDCFLPSSDSIFVLSNIDDAQTSIVSIGNAPSMNLAITDFHTSPLNNDDFLRKKTCNHLPLGTSSIKVKDNNFNKLKSKIINKDKTHNTSQDSSEWSGFAIAGFVCSLVGFFLFLLTRFPFLLGTLGIIFSSIGLAQTIKKDKKGKGLAIAGLIIGILTVLLFWFLFAIILWIILNFI